LSQIIIPRINCLRYRFYSNRQYIPIWKDICQTMYNCTVTADCCRIFFSSNTFTLAEIGRCRNRVHNIPTLLYYSNIADRGRYRALCRETWTATDRPTDDGQHPRGMAVTRVWRIGGGCGGRVDTVGPTIMITIPNNT